MNVSENRFWRLATLCVLVVWIGGCGTMKLPPRLSDAERSAISQVRIDASVGVGGPFANHVRKDVVAIVQDTKIFTRVAPIETFDQPPDLVIGVTRMHGGKAIIPLFTIFTLGVAPTFFTDDVGYGLAIGTPTSERLVEVDYHYESRSGLGFLSAVLNILPGWVHPTARPPRRLARRFAVEIAAREDEIRELLAQEP